MELQSLLTRHAFMQFGLVPNHEGCMQDLYMPIGMGYCQHLCGCGEGCVASSSQLAVQVVSLTSWQPIPRAPSDIL